MSFKTTNLRSLSVLLFYFTMSLDVNAHITSTEPTSYDGSFTVNWQHGDNIGCWEDKGDWECVTLWRKIGSGAWSYYTDSGSYSKAFSGQGINTYYYRICEGYGSSKTSAKNNCDYVTQGTTTVTVKNPNTPGTPSGPGTDYDGGFTISWSAQTGSTSYQLQEKKNSGSWSTVHNALPNSDWRGSRTIGTWYYRVRACGPLGCSSYSGTKSVVVKVPNIPTTPTGPSSDNNGVYTISWSSVTGAATFRLEEKLNSGSWDEIHNATYTITSKARSGLGNGTWYYRLRACSAVGCSGYSGTKSVINAITPGVPASISVSPTTSYDGSHTVTWGASSGSVTTYRLERKIDSGSYSQIYSGLPSPLNQGYSGLADGTYTYRVRACKTVSSVTNCSGYRTLGTGATVSNIPGLPGTPSSSDGGTSTDGAYTISWTAASGTVVDYELEEKVDNDNWAQVQKSSALNLAFSGKGDADYSYRVRACNTSGCSAYTSTTMVTVLLIPGVPGASSSSDGSSSLDGAYTISWTVATGTVSTYTLEEQVDGGGWAVVQNTVALSKVFTGKVDGTYDYRVKACNASGCSITYNAVLTVEVLHLPGMPGTFTISALDKGFVEPGFGNEAIARFLDSIIKLPIGRVSG